MRKSTATACFNVPNRPCTVNGCTWFCEWFAVAVCVPPIWVPSTLMVNFALLTSAASDISRISVSGPWPTAFGVTGSGGTSTGVVSTPSGEEIGCWATAGIAGSLENARM